MAVANEEATTALRALLERQREQLMLLGDIEPYMRSCDRRHGLCYWWLEASETEAFVLNACFHRTSEALAVLRFAQQVDTRLCVDQINQIWWTSAKSLDELVRDLNEDKAEIGIRFDVFSPEDLGPISERVFGVEHPTPGHLEDYAYLCKTFPSVHMMCGIPISLRIGFPGLDPTKWSFLLRQILQLVMAQQLPEATQHDHEPDPLAASRFRIVDLQVDTSTLFISTDKALQYLARLCENNKEGWCFERTPVGHPTDDATRLNASTP